MVHTLTLADYAMLMDNPVWVIAPIGAVVALIVAFVLRRGVKARSAGDARGIGGAGAAVVDLKGGLARQFKVVAIAPVCMVVVIALLSALGVQDIWAAAGVAIAGLLSGLCGWLGMVVGARVVAPPGAGRAKDSLSDGVVVAFRGAAVLGLVVVGFALLDLSLWFFLWNAVLPERSLVDITAIMMSFALGASAQAMFGGAGGWGAGSEAADVGVKVVADVYDSYYASVLAAMVLGAAAAFGMGLTTSEASVIAMKLVLAPIALAGLGVVCSLLGVFIAGARGEASIDQLARTARIGVWAASALIVVGAAGLFWFMFREVAEVSGVGVWGSLVAGVMAGLTIGGAMDYYTSKAHAGSAMAITRGLAVGMMSTWAPIVMVVVALLLAFVWAGGRHEFALGLYGIGIAAVGMSSTLGITTAAGGCGVAVRGVRGAGRGLAIGCAALTALALLASYAMVVQTSLNRQLTPGEGEIAAMIAKAGGPAAAGGEEGHEHDHGEEAHEEDGHDHAEEPSHDEHEHEGEHDHAAEGHEHDEHDHHDDARTGVLIAEYRGAGKFAVIDRSDDDQAFGGVMRAAGQVAEHFNDAHRPGDVIVFEDSTYDDGLHAYHVAVTYQHGDHAHKDHFEILPVDRATVSEVMAYYDVGLMNPRVLGGLLLGVMLMFVFCGFSMSAGGRNGHGMTIAPVVLAFVMPVIVGLVLDVAGVMGLLVGGLTSGFALAIFVVGAGGAWRDAGTHAGEVSVSVLIKFIAVVSIVFAGFVVKYGPIVGAWIGLG